MLKKKGKERIKIKEIMKHKWFKRYNIRFYLNESSSKEKLEAE